MTPKDWSLGYQTENREETCGKRRSAAGVWDGTPLGEALGEGLGKSLGTDGGLRLGKELGDSLGTDDGLLPGEVWELGSAGRLG